MLKKTLAILFVGLFLITGCSSHEEDFSNYYESETSQTIIIDSHEHDEPEKINGYEASPKKEGNLIDEGSEIQYDINPRIADNIDFENFKREFESFLSEQQIKTNETDVLTVRDDGLLTINLKLNTIMFDAQVDGEDRVVITCVVGNGEYEFSVLGED